MFEECTLVRHAELGYSFLKKVRVSTVILACLLDVKTRLKYSSSWIMYFLQNSKIFFFRWVIEFWSFQDNEVSVKNMRCFENLPKIAFSQWKIVLESWFLAKLNILGIQRVWEGQKIYFVFFRKIITDCRTRVQL